jgi:hypothetical protein
LNFRLRAYVVGITPLTPGFLAPASISRPRGSRRIDVYSPKLRRRLQCFSEAIYHQCLCLEADPTVLSYCERPAYLTIDNEKHLADFWARRADCEWLLFVGDSKPSFMARIGSVEYEVRAVPAAELAAARVWIENWERMLPVVTSCRDLLMTPLMDAVRRFVSRPTPLTHIEQEFAIMDLTLVRAVVFTLLHSGRLSAPTSNRPTLPILTDPAQTFGTVTARGLAGCRRGSSKIGSLGQKFIDNNSPETNKVFK